MIQSVTRKPTHAKPIKLPYSVGWVSLGSSYIENDSQIWIFNAIDKIIIEISNPLFEITQ